ncbi:MAG: DUF3786 domain-containing protein [Eubacteriales bacterium]
MENDTNMTNGYIEAFSLACSELGKKDPEQIALDAGCILERDTGRLTFRFLGEQYWVEYPGGEVGRMDGVNVAITIKVLILHYLLHAKKAELTGTLISFREVRGGGENYYPVFQKRVEQPLLQTFELNPSYLIHCGLRLGGTMGSFGSASVKLPVFPNVPVTYVVWQQEDELSSSCAILFDSSISDYLPCEDIVLAASFGVYALIYELKQRIDQQPK